MPTPYRRKAPPAGAIARHRGVLGASMVLALGGCAARVAPSFELFGAYFPAWMLCALLGIVAAVLVRVALVATGLANALPLPLFACASVGVCAALLAWLYWFGS